MNRAVDNLRRHPGLSLGAVLLGAALLGLGWGVYASRLEMLRTEQRLIRLEREWTGFQRNEAVADPSAVTTLQTRVDHEAARREVLQAALRGGETGRAWREAKPPIVRTDAYFDLAAFVERMRAAAREAGVGIRAEEQFGFADYRGAGPEPEHIAVVFRQRQMLDHLLSQLFVLGPQRLDRVARTRPTGAAAAGARMATLGRDEFVPDGWTTPLPGRSSVIACRISFTAQTEVLRRWLNRIAEFDAPLVVRLVEAEPVEPAAGPASGTPAVDSGVVLVVPQSLSQFTVTVEYLEPIVTEGEKS